MPGRLGPLGESGLPWISGALALVSTLSLGQTVQGVLDREPSAHSTTLKALSPVLVRVFANGLFIQHLWLVISANYQPTTQQKFVKQLLCVFRVGAKDRIGGKGQPRARLSRILGRPLPDRRPCGRVVRTGFESTLSLISRMTSAPGPICSSVKWDKCYFLLQRSG